MKTLVPYLFFTGNCREAMNFYADCLNGEITKMETCGEAEIEFSPEADEMIFDSEMKAGEICIKASDNPQLKPEETEEKNFSLFINLPEKNEFEKVASKLSEGGKVLMKHDGQFIMLRDKFGFSWMLTFG